MNRRISIYSLLISLSLNLLLLLILSLIREQPLLQSKESVSVEFPAPVREIVQRLSFIVLPKDTVTDIRRTPSARVDMPVARDTVLTKTVSSVSAGVPSASSIVAELQSFSREPEYSISPRGDRAGDREQGTGAAVRSNRSGIGGESGGQVARGITIRQPKAVISGSGDSLKGYYNISLVRYEDTSDTISPDALAQLAMAMNKWTKIKTRVIKEPLMLDDPELLQVPMIYIASRRPFAFSQRERENLGKYLNAGGFLLFSNAADSESDARGVANSIEFELWKVLDSPASNLADVKKEHRIYNTFFDISDRFSLRGIVINGRISVAYEASGYGEAWITGQDIRQEKYLKLGVNIIVYALTTSPVVQRN